MLLKQCGRIHSTRFITILHQLRWRRSIAQLIECCNNSVKFKCISVDGGHRSIIFSRIGGIQKEIYPEGLHFRVPWFQYPIIYDIRAKPKKLTSPTGSKGQYRVPVSKGQYRVSVSKGQYRVPVCKGRYRVPVSKGQQRVPVSKGRQGVPVSKGKYRLLVSKGQQRVIAMLLFILAHLTKGHVSFCLQVVPSLLFAFTIHQVWSN